MTVRPKQSEREDCLAKAKWAEEMAAQFADGFYRVSWLHIAQGYRDMIEQIDKAEAAAQPRP
jgi:hypothetical protein